MENRPPTLPTDYLVKPCTAFAGTQLLAAGPLIEVVLAVKNAIEDGSSSSVLVFDDTTEHEAWNHSQSDRVVLLLDFKRSEPGAEVFQPLDWVKNIAQKQERSI